jgi:predicted nucleic acid-binding protein
VNDVVVLDSGPVGVLTNPHRTAVVLAARQWLTDLLAAGRQVLLPEISDYEVRREYVRANLRQSLTLLDSLGNQVNYQSITTSAMRRAADLWALARNAGLPTAPDPALDGDVILAAQALTLNAPVIVATDNAAHLSRFVPADTWQNISP